MTTLTSSEPAVLGRADSAAPGRTLVDVFRATVRRHANEPAIDAGGDVLTYDALRTEVDAVAARLSAAGIGRGDRVGIRLPSGTAALYVAILGVLSAGAAYVPVDADDPEERARLVFAEAGVARVLDDPALDQFLQDGPAHSRPEESRSADRPLRPRTPSPEQSDDAWIIFTSGSTGTPKGVAVSHRSAAAFVDAEAGLFLPGAPIGPGDRVLAGLSVAFDASCEEMWLAWRRGACLVPAPRSLVRSGLDLGPWLAQQRITVVSTVPTLAALWPAQYLDRVRLLIFGGEACPVELAERLVDDDREVWNTYGPTEATVVACAARLTEDGPVRIGLPLAGWELAVVDADARPVPDGEVGELIVGGVGLARYLDPVKDAEKFAAMPSLGWARAYRSGDLVRYDGSGLLFEGRADEQVKLGGRRIELGEVDAALQALPGVAGAAAAVQATSAGNQILVGYLAVPEGSFDAGAALTQLRARLPAALVPALAVVSELPTRTSGKVDRSALPWPLPALNEAEHQLGGTAGWLAEQWTSILGANVAGADDDFFAHGGGSLAAAQLVSVLRQRFAQATVADIYAHPRLGDLAAFLEASAPAASVTARTVGPVSPRTQAVQLAVAAGVRTLSGLRWLTLVALANNLLNVSWAPRTSWWLVAAGLVVFVSPFGRMALAVAGARALLRPVRPGTYPRGGQMNLRVWAAERLADAVAADNLAAAPWISVYARALGATIGRGVALHALPPITGMLSLGAGCSIEPEVDLTGHWLDGDQFHVGRVRIGAGAVIGSRSTLAPGTKIGKNAEIEAGSSVSGFVPDGERWAGAPAVRVGPARHDWPPVRPRPARAWILGYGATAALFALYPVLAAVPGLALLYRAVEHRPSVRAAALHALPVAVPATLIWIGGYALLTLVSVRLLGLGLREGHSAVRSRIGWQVWSTERLMDAARTLLFPLYSSLFTPVWLRWLGADIGRGVEASTVLLLPKMTSVGDGAFLADDTMIASYELGGGWLRIERASVGKRAFLGNSGMTAAGRAVPKRGLIAVLSATPEKAKKGTSWLGSPPVQLRRDADDADATLTFTPPRRLQVLRAAVEICRLAAPVVSTLLALGVAVVFEILLAHSVAVAALLGGVVLIAAGIVAATVTVAVKVLLVGRLTAVEHPLWSSFVWRNELADTFVETVAAPWFADAFSGTAALCLWLRTLGAHIGRGVWCETYWLPEADLVTLGAGATVNRGCVLQTHLFHDRILRMDAVTLGAGATIGPHSVILPAASIGAHATVGPASLVMRGEAVPAGSRWIGNPIAAWPRRPEPRKTG